MFNDILGDGHDFMRFYHWYCVIGLSQRSQRLRDFTMFIHGNLKLFVSIKHKGDKFSFDSFKRLLQSTGDFDKVVYR